MAIRLEAAPVTQAGKVSAQSEAELSFQRGRHYSNRYNNQHLGEDLELARGAFQRALELDPMARSDNELHKIAEGTKPICGWSASIIKTPGTVPTITVSRPGVLLSREPPSLRVLRLEHRQN